MADGEKPWLIMGANADNPFIYRGLEGFDSFF